MIFFDLHDVVSFNNESLNTNPNLTFLNVQRIRVIIALFLTIV